MTSQQERHEAHAELVAVLEANWEVRQLELKGIPPSWKSQNRPARIMLEEEYQSRLGDLVRDYEVIQRQQVTEREALEANRKSAHDTVLVAFEAAESSLLNERHQVDEWRRNLRDEETARRQQIDKGERRALDEIERIEAREELKAENTVDVYETEMEGVAREMEKKTGNGADNLQHTPITRTAVVTVASAQSQHRKAEKAPAFELGAAIGCKGAEADAPAVPPAAQHIQASTTPPFDASTGAAPSGEDSILPASSGSTCIADELDPLLLDNSFAIPTYPPNLLPEIKSQSSAGYEFVGKVGSKCIHAEAAVTSAVQERSGTPDSVGSGFVEI